MIESIFPGGGAGKRTARFIIGTSTAGWTAADCDYLCDGVDDQAEINAAISALPSTGGKIVLLDGEYVLSASCSIIKRGVTISGSGSGTFLKLGWTPSSITDSLIRVVEYYSTIENISLTTGLSYLDTYNTGIHVGAYAMSIRNVRFYNFRHAVYGEKSCPTVSDCSFVYPMRYAIMVNGATGGSISGNTIGAQWGVSIKGESSRISVCGNRFSDTEDAVTIHEGSFNNTVSGNTIFHNYGVGVKIVGSSGNAIVGNTFAADKTSSIQIRTGVIINKSSYNVIAENVIKGVARGIVISCDEGSADDDYSRYNSAIGNIIDTTGVLSSTTKYTILLSGSLVINNSISFNIIWGKNYTVDAVGPGNTFVNNKYN